MEKENFHAGHRERMMSKLINNSDSLLDHELLEILLFYAIPRVDTNPLAHKILRVFGSVEKVFCAEHSELTAVDGVGQKTANLIVTVGKLYQAANKKKAEKIRLLSFYDVQKVVKEIFEVLEHEMFIVLMLDKNHNLITKLEFSDEKRYEVTADIPELSKGLAINKPAYAIVVHNHNSASLSPSKKDDIATKKIHLLCEVHGVSLIDHVIFAQGEFFSYHHSGRMEYIKGDDTINNFLINNKENNYE